MSTRHDARMDASSSVIVGVGTSVVAMLVAWLLYRARFHPLQALRGPPSTHVIAGNGREFANFAWSATRPFPEPFASWTKTYGTAFYYRVLFQHRVNLADPVSLQHVLVTKAANYPRDTIPRSILRTLLGGDGLLSSEDQVHAGQRKHLHPPFSQTNLKAFVSIFAAETATLLSVLDAMPDGHIVDVPDLLTRLTLNVIGKTAFGYDFNTLDPTNNQAAIALSAFDKLNTPPRPLYILGLAFLPHFEHWPLPYLRQIQTAKSMLFRIVDDVIAHKVATPAPAFDLLDLLLADAAMTATEARVHVMTFMFAGHETTSSTLSWVLAMLATHPAVEAAVVDECRRALANAGGAVSWQTLSDLSLLTATIYETLRLYPTVPFITMRTCTHDDWIPRTDDDPFFMPKGAQATFCVGAIHQHARYWSRPTEFLPARFLDGSPEHEADALLRHGNSSRFTFVPFSLGPKNCIGKRFAIAEMQTVLLHLLPRFALTRTPASNLTPKLTGVTIKPTALPLRLLRR
ncbi:hypothetical protein, variant [Saprolegnia diclina VS20]|uniref:Cytochrome P450 n=1 Tax=Saprolegnia diclina (strain VS20) TaxID=1156394 RepID=T0QYG8_SAPDV|nr:hypothetical protein, variant [Saprolegnia diclina VS20]EQC39736.1 hypothetical protein, variant [Saprolegnia diclina VS20]|eukprot:XP_008607008.1 hypothetical protein, variant [Saprolegnia diclina VS20]